jgi:hypothetical protein
MSAALIDQETLVRAGPDPLGILAPCAAVVNAARFVAIDREAADRLAGELRRNQALPPAWDAATHFQAGGGEAIEQTIGWTFVLDALNFCFWAQGPDPAWRWRIASGGSLHDGYMALAIALRDAARAGVPLWERDWLANVDEAALSRIFAPAPGSAPIPLLAERVANLRELGRNLPAGDAGRRPWTTFVERSGGSAPELVRTVVDTFPSFNDVAAWVPPGAAEPAIAVPFLKRAQILASDLWGALTGMPGSPRLADREQLTAFADYKVPQVMREAGILIYAPTLAGRIRRRDLLAPGSREEIEIRSATIWGCELVRQGLGDGGAHTAADVDWLLWNAGQTLGADPEPYHRTVTIFY